MPALICIFADWLEKFLRGSASADLRESQVRHRIEERTPYTAWPFALTYKGSGSLLIY
ncbi:hypothetical protein C4J98_3961 [Pseudomonas orientalis]|nr:hypothetical protein C4J98_3961 [Pseudomonas orientalis]